MHSRSYSRSARVLRRADEAAPAARPEPKTELALPANVKFINGTERLPIIGSTFKAPGFTSQGYIEITENTGPHACFINLNAGESTLSEADQTPDKFSDVIIYYNKEVRANYKKYGYDGVIDIRALLATGADSPYWKPNMAGDGTHFGRHPANELIAPEARKILK